MPLEKWLVDADVFLSDNMIAVNGGHAIDHQEGIAVRQHLHDLVHVQNRAVLHNGFAAFSSTATVACRSFSGGGAKVSAVCFGGLRI